MTLKYYFAGVLVLFLGQGLVHANKQKIYGQMQQVSDGLRSIQVLVLKTRLRRHKHPLWVCIQLETGKKKKVVCGRLMHVLDKQPAKKKTK